MAGAAQNLETGTQTDLRGGTKTQAQEGLCNICHFFQAIGPPSSDRKDLPPPVAVQMNPSLACLADVFVYLGKLPLRKMSREIHLRSGDE